MLLSLFIDIFGNMIEESRGTSQAFIQRPRPEIFHSVSDVRTSKVCGAKSNRNVIQIRRDIISLRHRARDMDLVVV